MHVEAFTEERSTAAALEILVPRMVGRDTTVEVHASTGRSALFARIPSVLRSYGAWVPRSTEVRVLLLVDRDSDDCRALKRRMVRLLRDAGLAGSSLARIAVEELEAWFLGDVAALGRAYPGIDPNLARRRGLRDPDAVRGGTWEALERVLQEAGYFPGGLQKIAAARAIAAEMDVESNRSRSFQVFRDGLRSLCA